VNSERGLKSREFTFFDFCWLILHIRSLFTDIECQFYQRFTHSFYARRSPKAQKRQSSHQCLLHFWGSAYVKASHKTLMKLTPTHLLSTNCSLTSHSFSLSLSNSISFSLSFILCFYLCIIHTYSNWTLSKKLLNNRYAWILLYISLYYMFNVWCYGSKNFPYLKIVENLNNQLTGICYKLNLVLVVWFKAQTNFC